MVLQKINEQIATVVLKWSMHDGAWFDKNDHYKEEVDNFNPSQNLNDTYYVMQQLKGDWHIHNIGSNWDVTFVQYKYGGFVGTIDKTLPLAICKCMLEASSA